MPFKSWKMGEDYSGNQMIFLARRWWKAPETTQEKPLAPRVGGDLFVGKNEKVG